MEEIISREIAKELMGIEGKVRGAVFKADVDFITKEKGREGLKKIEERMESLGYIFKYDEKEKRIVVDRIENFNVHPIFCVYLLDILSGFHEVARGTKKPTAKEVKCSFLSDEYHEFLIKW